MDARYDDIFLDNGQVSPQNAIGDVFSRVKRIWISFFHEEDGII